MKTAQYFLDNAYLGGKDIESGVIEAMIEFAKMQVSEALKSASEKFDAECNKQVILCSYKLDDIN